MPDVVVVGEAANGIEARAAIARLTPDVVLLDVEMPGQDGLALAETPGLPPIVFTTAHVQFAADAFDLEAVDYLIKPIRQDRLERALERIRRHVRTTAPAAATRRPDSQLTLHDAGSVRFVDALEVTWFRALDKYTEFTLRGEQLLLRESLDALEARLGPLGFLRVHRAGLVRLDAVAALESDGGALTARLKDGSHVEVSRRNAAELKRQLGLRR